MPYELRVNGVPLRTYETPDPALDYVRLLLQHDPDAEPEIIDTATGYAFAPAASTDWREELATRIGF